jgi:lysophospholipase L1-like esterase
MIMTQDRRLGRRVFSTRLLGGVLAAAVLAAAVSVRAQGPRAGERWVGTWATAVMVRTPPTPQTQQAPQAPPAAGGPAAGGQGLGSSLVNFNNQTLRQIVHVSIGGDAVRVVLSNAYGTAPMQIGAAHVALRDKDAAIVAQSARPLLFSGHATATIPPGAVLVSDPIRLSVPPLADLAIDLYLPGNTDNLPVTMHAAAWQSGYVSATGNFSGASTFPVEATTEYMRNQQPCGSWFFLARVEVVGPEPSAAVVTIGDSITDGTQSGHNTNNRWPDHLARRFAQAHLKLGVLNVGIGGNRVLGDGNGINALARFDRDVLAQTGVAHLIVFEGINDIQGNTANPPSAADLIAADRQMIERAHAHGIKIYGATVTPFGGAGGFTPEREAKRQELNQWIRSSKMYDAVIDFEAAVRDPKEPTKIRPEFDPGDHLHMNAAGYKAMAESIDLALFTSGAGASRTAAVR